MLHDCFRPEGELCKQRCLVTPVKVESVIAKEKFHPAPPGLGFLKELSAHLKDKSTSRSYWQSGSSGQGSDGPRHLCLAIQAPKARSLTTLLHCTRHSNRFLGRATPWSDPAEQRHEIIQNKLVFGAEESVSGSPAAAAAGQRALAPFGDPCRASARIAKYFSPVGQLRPANLRPIRRRWPDEPATLQPPDVERHANAVMPDDFDGHRNSRHSVYRSQFVVVAYRWHRLHGQQVRVYGRQARAGRQILHRGAARALA
jgi:hypothetical protein